MAKQRIRIRLKAFDHRLRDQAAAQSVETAPRTGADVVGPVPRPTRSGKVTVLRSPVSDPDAPTTVTSRRRATGSIILADGGYRTV